jgi:hypothetical protein
MMTSAGADTSGIRLSARLWSVRVVRANAAVAPGRDIAARTAARCSAKSAGRRPG